VINMLRVIADQICDIVQLLSGPEYPFGGKARAL